MRTINLKDFETDWNDEVGGNLSEHLKSNLYRFNQYIEELNKIIDYAKNISENDYHYEMKTDIIDSLLYKEEK